jgi:hypothetical protein
MKKYNAIEDRLLRLLLEWQAPLERMPWAKSRLMRLLDVAGGLSLEVQGPLEVQRPS